MGGWVTAMTASKDSGFFGAILISAADMGLTMGTREQLVAAMAPQRRARERRNWFGKKKGAILHCISH